MDFSVILTRAAFTLSLGLIVGSDVPGQASESLQGGRVLCKATLPPHPPTAWIPPAETCQPCYASVVKIMIFTSLPFTKISSFSP